MTWQPIETAPRDGTWFLIWRADEGPESCEIGCYDPNYFYNYVEVDGGLFRREKTTGYEWRGFNNFHRATHWQLLPPPPETES